MTRDYENKRRSRMLLLLFTAIFILIFMGSFMIGKYHIGLKDLFTTLFSGILGHSNDAPSQMEIVVMQVRFPRILAAAIIGAALSAAGLCYQGLFQNPMVSPDVLGASTGAGFGAALGLFMSFGYFGVSLSALFFGIIAVVIVQLVSGRVKNNPVLALILSGIMVSSLFSAATSFIKLVADPTNVLPTITYWLMGSLASIRQSDLLFVSIPILLGIIPLLLIRWRLNILTLGEEEARTVGLDTKKLRVLIIFCATLLTAACVSVSGMIGWVGLVIPHISRMLVGCDHRVSLPASMLLGSSFLMVVDNFCRILTTTEIPLGILTAFVGAPFFLYLLVREGKLL
ncbi:MAG: iron ABC transporter permease [Anaerovoracaceae bacterium]